MADRPAGVRARLGSVIKALSPIAGQTGLSIKARVERSALLPERSFANSVPLDLSKDFYPFGEQPRLNDAFYLTLPDEAAKPNATITISITPISSPGACPHTAIRRSLHRVGSMGWHHLARAAEIRREDARPRNLHRQRQRHSEADLARAASPTPDQRRHGLLAARPDHRGQLRDPAGCGGDQRGQNRHHGGRYGPPSLAALQLAYTAEQQHSAMPTTIGRSLIAGRLSVNLVGPPCHSSRPRRRKAGVYLGFNAALANRPMTLYVHVDAPRPGEVAQAMATARQALPPPPQVRWEYASAAQDSDTAWSGG